MTPMEFDVLCSGFIKAQPGYVEPVTRADFEALKARFPDKPRAGEKVH